MTHLHRLHTLKVGRDFGIKRIEVNLFQGEMHGWIDINLAVDGLTTTIEATVVFPPFDDLTEFLKDVIVGSFPAECEIEEEGPMKRLIALALPDPELFRFQLTSASREDIFMDNIFVRSQFALAFFLALKTFERRHFNAELWGISWMFDASTEPLRILIEQTFPEESAD